MERKRSPRLAAIGFALLITTISSWSGPVGADAPSGSGGATQVVAPVPDLTWTGCGGGLQCATARVPLDYDAPAGKKIELSLIRRPAADRAHRIGSLFVNDGGPGNSVIDFVRGDAASVLPVSVQKRFDVVGFDPRGVGRSTPLRCFGSVEAQQRFFGSRPPFPVSPEETRAFTATSAEIGRRCGARGSALLAHMSTANGARDLDLLRRAVGDEQLTFAGYSYGGLLGITYANLFPGKVRALVLDGAPDPVQWTTGRSSKGTTVPVTIRLAGPKATTGALHAFLDGCQRAPGPCSFASGDTSAKLDALLERLRRGRITVDLRPGPFTPGGPAEVTYSQVVDGLRGALTFPPIWGDLADLLTTSTPRRRAPPPS